MCFLPKGLGWLPLIYIIASILTFAFRPVPAIDNASSLLSKPSNSAAKSYGVERNVFGLLLSLCCVFGTGICVVRFLEHDNLSSTQYRGYQRVNVTKLSENMAMSRLNWLALAMGIIVMQSGFVIAAFQIGGESAKIVYFIATYVFFIFAFFYCCLQTTLTYMITPQLKGLLRSQATIICLLSFVMVIFVCFAFGKSDFISVKNKMLVIKALEWILVLLLCVFVATFTCGFETMSIDFHVGAVENNNDPENGDF